MNVTKIIRCRNQPVTLIRQGGKTVKLVRAATEPVRLVNEKGVVIFGGATDADQIRIKTDLSTYYQLKKQS